ncbi:MAG: ParB N-terminal domain-containing protein, partial [Candidatus Bathyarchaeia archaeon]|nr:ParB N-terminal domain-containing protein [Candidatus Bathyarchaeia archaeon]
MPDRGEKVRKEFERTEEEEMSEILTVNLRLADLETGVFSPKKVFSQGYNDELADSIQKEGQLKPIVVRPHPSKPDCWQVIDGEHRIRVLEKL